MVDVSSATYMGVPLISTGMLALSLLMIIVASSFNLALPYYMAFFLLFSELLRLLVGYPFGEAPAIVWGLRGVFLLAVMFILPKVFSTYMDSGSGRY